MSVHEVSPLPPVAWGRSVGVSAIVLALLAVAAAVWVTGKPSAAYAPGGVAVSGYDYGFSPGSLTWQPGERVTLTFVNDSSGIPGKQHELMIGRGPVAEETVFGPKVTGGFAMDFFEGVDITLLEAEGVSMVMPGDAFVFGLDLIDMSKMDMSGAGDHGGASQFMLLLDPGGRATIRFRVPSKPGRWELGCFQQSGQHYANGMRGVVTIARA